MPFVRGRNPVARRFLKADPAAYALPQGATTTVKVAKGGGARYDGSGRRCGGRGGADVRRATDVEVRPANRDEFQFLRCRLENILQVFAVNAQLAVGGPPPPLRGYGATAFTCQKLAGLPGRSSPDGRAKAGGPEQRQLEPIDELDAANGSLAATCVEWFAQRRSPSRPSRRDTGLGIWPSFLPALNSRSRGFWYGRIQTELSVVADDGHAIFERRAND